MAKKDDMIERTDKKKATKKSMRKASLKVARKGTGLPQGGGGRRGGGNRPK